MDRLDSLVIFVALAEQGSFIGASRKLGRSPTAVSRAVATLENEWGAQLFTRTTRANALTKVGEIYLEQARRVIAEYDMLKDAVATQGDFSGLITITAPEMFGRMHVLPLVQDYMAMNSRVEISLLLLNRIVSFIDEGVDLGFRIAHLADSSLRAIRLGEVRQVLSASPDYLAKAGVPIHPRDLAGHRIIATTGGRPLPGRWRFRTGQGERNVQVKAATRGELGTGCLGSGGARRWDRAGSILSSGTAGGHRSAAALAYHVRIASRSHPACASRRAASATAHARVYRLCCR